MNIDYRVRTKGDPPPPLQILQLQAANGTDVVLQLRGQQ